ncbi:MAG: hypothetical protein COW19_05270 [Zetaproteobacteria bacterium CG12_big_fil_rev_8_21_14_0_65_55_1124]|nr:MAG: hypothetical protein AUJ58_00610 [Zetaproteobacteria bacterium CG1_02_55_237]PIS19426.1 MAG: hypothetical protein COT53_05780 [Zetaproteobacteria bacterium CG08_land_8_20_14_0_20_55_17]PIW42996.1 MAG: hypothetical protein COW19_05270 [Zetaproteobacteria bacterium CG12_big_fil_rev_8_21_14_0_65_55_1124]PIZ39224.1 MAG: hypothetical protein COY36_03650 [Zetaproteobacteria bacterium CG_4_10_14_0_2_um_filter_55_20]PJB80150.1 MAG: hypothetical protein CO089_08190 [Zetaproteobacteria bacterium 
MWTGGRSGRISSLCVPFILKKEIYASASLFGALAYLGLGRLGLSDRWVIWGVVLITSGTCWHGV